MDEKNRGDIAYFVWSSRIEEHNWNIQDTVKKEIIRRSEGVFLWASLVVTQIQLGGEQTPVQASTELLEIIPRSLENLYDYILDRIESSRLTRTGSKKLLRWIGLARRPLLLKELRSALELELPDSAEILPLISTSNANSLKLNLRSRFWGLVVVRKNIVIYCHRTLHDFLSTRVWTLSDFLEHEKVEILLSERSHLELAVSCLSLLSSEVKGIEANPHHKPNNLVRYAAKYWPEHAKLADSPKLSHDDLYQTLLDWSNTTAKDRTPPVSHDSPATFRWRSALHAAATYGLYNLTLALNVYEDPTATYWDEGDHNGRTALSFACERGHLSVVQLLVHKGASVRSRDRKHRFTPLHWAALQDHRSVAAQILKSGADLNDQWATCTPLSIAGCIGGEEVSQLLLAHGADPNLRDTCYGRTPLHYAAAYGRKRVVKLLLSRHADPNIEATYYGIRHFISLQCMVDWLLPRSCCPMGHGLTSTIGCGALHFCARLAVVIEMWRSFSLKMGQTHPAEGLITRSMLTKPVGSIEWHTFFMNNSPETAHLAARTNAKRARTPTRALPERKGQMETLEMLLARGHLTTLIRAKVVQKEGPKTDQTSAQPSVPKSLLPLKRRCA